MSQQKNYTTNNYQPPQIYKQEDNKKTQKKIDTINKTNNYNEQKYYNDNYNDTINKIQTENHITNEEIQIYEVPNINKEKQKIAHILIIVACVSVLFCVCEIVGGYIAKSLAIMTDAAHILSDVSGFIISIVAIKLSQIQVNKRMSFGYHRAEILGALASVLVIWGLTIWLVIQAIDRVINPVKIEEITMLATACLGLLFNLIQFKLLHNPKFTLQTVGNHNHNHNHDHDHAHTQHSHQHNHQKQEKQQNNGKKNINSKQSSNNQNDIKNQDSFPKLDEQDVIKKSISTNSSIQENIEPLNKNDQKSKQIKKVINLNAEESQKLEKLMENNQNQGNIYQNTLNQQDLIEVFEDSKENLKLTLLSNEADQDIEIQIKNELNQQNDIESSYKNDINTNNNDDINKISSQENQIQNQNLILNNQNHNHDENYHNNLNLRSAMIHVIGDLLQSIGVIIAALIIFFGGQKCVIADPICTFLFSIIVLITTKNVIKECILILMEASPTSINVVGIENDLINLDGVQELHDLHVWAISPSKFSLSVHIRTNNPSKTLVEATKICKKHKIYHRTIQIENSNECQIYNSNLCKELSTCK
ncbi:hypothetical protein PPERSA_07870 [Pseudocohnilembus persalinus]|uniref:Cation efflux protein n=1 Tax=Pseudocohnilembus persalinus TaxID=266149 RepID=A0A0V0QCA8_PSEPJ|nr:hypothetical protein PPERSA_07870 [Pseudocohnilembus persalinus]|eukprot:KRW99793.1 hypothetical protein PPERSA_07870 [Pseudocohnilembus persalinus]